jgi:hypothetical protein
MQLQSFARGAVACAIVSVGVAAHAADFTFSGNINLNTDIVKVTFSVNTDATNVDVWTDSFMSGTNYDPITALWQKAGNDYVLIGENDDDATIRPATQTYYDSGFHLNTLAAGDYLFTVGAYPNFAYGTMLSDGFDFDHDGTTVTAISDWCQPASNNCTDQKGTFWRVNLSGVDVAAPAVPEPSTYALLAFGLGALGWATRRQKKS